MDPESKERVRSPLFQPTARALPTRIRKLVFSQFSSKMNASSRFWSLEKEDEEVWLIVCGGRARNKEGNPCGTVESVQISHKGKDEFRFTFKGNADGMYLQRSMFESTEGNVFASKLKDTISVQEFIEVLTTLTKVKPVAKKRAGRSSIETTSPKRGRLDDSGVAEMEEEDKVPEPYLTTFRDKYLGRFTCNISQLRAPPDDIMVRPVSRPWVQVVKQQLSESMVAVQTFLPCLIDPDSLPNQQEFERCSIGQYILLTLGGNHLRTAAQDLLKEGKLCEAQRTFHVDLFAGLTNHQARHVGNLHNSQTETLKLGFTDKVRQARRLLYEMAELDIDLDEPPANTPPNFTQMFLEETACKKSASALSTVFHVARYPQACWAAFEAIVEKYEQTWSSSEPRQLNQTVFQSFQGLDKSNLAKLLKDVKIGSKSLKQAGAEAIRLKKLDVIQRAFARRSGAGSWAAAQRLYPEYTTDKRLSQFLSMQFKEAAGKGQKDSALPEAFVEYCEGARSSQDTDAWQVIIGVTHKGQPVSGEEIGRLVERYRKQITDECKALQQETTTVESEDS